MSEVERTEDKKYLESPDKSEYDKAEYRVVRLQNGLTATLISGLERANYDDINYKDYEENGPSTKRVKRNVSEALFCGLCVKVGSFNDPSELPGLCLSAWFSWDPKNILNEFVGLHGGTTYSVTDCEYTRFYFDISVKQLEPALDHFVQFFIEPLMKKDAIMREREIIENEFQSNFLSCDKNRKELVLSDITRIAPPPNRIRWKDLTSHNNIDDDKVYEELHKFRERYYSAHRMMLAIQARLPLDILETFVTKFFAKISSNWLPFNTFTKFKDYEFFDTVSCKEMYKVKPIKDISQLHVIWIIQSGQFRYFVIS